MARHQARLGCLRWRPEQGGSGTVECWVDAVRSPRWRTLPGKRSWRRARRVVLLREAGTGEGTALSRRPGDNGARRVAAAKKLRARQEAGEVGETHEKAGEVEDDAANARPRNGRREARARDVRLCSVQRDKRGLADPLGKRARAAAVEARGRALPLQVGPAGPHKTGDREDRHAVALLRENERGASVSSGP